ncbi:MAG: tetratricopeptide repeat protein [Acidobacteria bacterium]|nr:tetratricopeptide repeat protein [Acidobacteriota bacterium]
MPARLFEGLKVKISRNEKEQMNRPITTTPGAYEYVLRGNHLLIKSTVQTYRKEDLDAAVEMFKQALRLDPNFAQAYAGLGRCDAKSRRRRDTPGGAASSLTRASMSEPSKSSRKAWPSSPTMQA